MAIEVKLSQCPLHQSILITHFGCFLETFLYNINCLTDCVGYIQPNHYHAKSSFQTLVEMEVSLHIRKHCI